MSSILPFSSTLMHLLSYLPSGSTRAGGGETKTLSIILSLTFPLSCKHVDSLVVKLKLRHPLFFFSLRNPIWIEWCNFIPYQLNVGSMTSNQLWVSECGTKKKKQKFTNPVFYHQGKLTVPRFVPLLLELCPSGALWMLQRNQRSLFPQRETFAPLTTFMSCCHVSDPTPSLLFTYCFPSLFHFCPRTIFLLWSTPTPLLYIM